MKKKNQSIRNRRKKVSQPKASRPRRPRRVHLAIRKLLDTTNHIQARAAELENALDELREQERIKAVKDLLLALRNSANGDLLRFDSTVPVENDRTRAIVDAVSEAFSIVPLHQIGERIPVRDGKIPDSLELDRSIGEEVGKCVAAEIVSVGWKFKEQTIIKPVVRPLFRASS
jgi:hypothetical protein